MNKYKVIYYVVAIALLVSLCLLIGTNLGWFDLYYSDQFIWAYFVLIPVIEWIEKKSKNLASEKKGGLLFFDVYCLGRFLGHVCRDV